MAHVEKLMEEVVTLFRKRGIAASDSGVFTKGEGVSIRLGPQVERVDFGDCA